MTFGFAAALRGLPALAGVLIGAYLFAAPPHPGAPFIPVIVVVLLTLLLALARHVFIARPVLGLALLEPWTIAAVAVVSVCTQVILWATVTLELLIPLAPSEAKAVAAAVIGALTTFAATSWLKEIQESQGAFVASAQARDIMERFAVHHGIVGDSVAFDLCYSEQVALTQGKIKGWGMVGRWKRANLLGSFLKGGKKPLTR